MTDNDIKVGLMNERAKLKREKCHLRNEIRDAGLAFQQMHAVSNRVLEGFVDAKVLVFSKYPTFEDFKEKVARIDEIGKRVTEIEDCVPELKA